MMYENLLNLYFLGCKATLQWNKNTHAARFATCHLSVHCTVAAALIINCIVGIRDG
jgi:hypothetical protein